LVAVRCKPGRLVGVTAQGLIGRSVCKSARSLVILDQNPNVLVYLQPAAPVPTLARRRKACSATSSPRPARYVEKGSNIVLWSRHELGYNALNEVVIEKAMYT